METDPSQLSESYVVLLRQLAASLEFSTQAVVSGHVTRLEERTAAQRLLWQKVLALSQCSDHHSNSDWPATAEVLAAQRRVLHLGRVQHALLQRAQQNLRAVSNQLAGLHSGYAPIRGEEGVELRPVGKEE
jgi:DNA-binding MurR/RpiR family transcriptional regulator